jgi:hypothetical protein
MQLTHILTVALLALGVSTTPSGTIKDPKPCYGGQVYNDAHKKCECPPKQSWGDKNKCSYPPIEPPQCPSPQKPWCSKSKTEYCEYGKSSPTSPISFKHRTDSHPDKGNDYCQDNGQNSVWCCDEKNKDKCMGDHYPPTPPSCPDKQKWCGTDKKCKCPKPMEWNDDEKKCKYPPIPKPNCPWPQKPWCGKSKSKYCAYGKKHLA